MRTTTRAALLAPLLLMLAGCAPVIALDPADDATSTHCADVIVRLPETVADLSKRETNAQSTAAWGEPAWVILRCGVPSPAPTATFPCLTVGGVDWLRDDSKAPNFVFTTYGRTPATEVIINGDEASARAALTDLADAVSRLPVTGACVSPEDTTG